MMKKIALLAVMALLLCSCPPHPTPTGPKYGFPFLNSDLVGTWSGSYTEYYQFTNPLIFIVALSKGSPQIVDAKGNPLSAWDILPITDSGFVQIYENYYTSDGQGQIYYSGLMNASKDSMSGSLQDSYSSLVNPIGYTYYGIWSVIKK